MNAKHLVALSAALVAASTLTACGSGGEQQDSSIDFAPIAGDEFSANPGAWQTDGVPVPEKGVAMVGDPVAAQAVANAGLEQGTVTASSDDTTVYYPQAPAVPGLPVGPQEVAPPPPQLVRPVNTPPWNYTRHQIAVYQQICETGRWNDWTAGEEVQSQTCWTLYGRQLGVRPWHPGEPKPWDRPSWPKPWFEPGFRSDVPVMWVYPRDWTRPRPQPVVSVSIGLNVPGNPHARPNPHRPDAFEPVWAVTPGRPVAARDQGRVVAPFSRTSGPTVRAGAPVYPGVVLPALPASGRADVVTALPGGDGEWNPNRDRTVLGPVARAIAGASVYNVTRSDLVRTLGEDVDVHVPTSRARTSKATTTTRTARSSAAATTSRAARPDDATTTRTSAGATSAAPSTTTSRDRSSTSATASSTTRSATSAPKSTSRKPTGSAPTTKPTTKPSAKASATTTTPAR